MNNYTKVSITDGELNTFLRDVEENCEIYTIEEAKDKKNELIEIAKKRGILVEGSFDLGALKLVYVFPDKANANKDRIPKDELLKKLPTLIGKPLSIDHIRRYTIGYFIDYSYVEKENKVIAYAIVFKEIFKKEWEQFQELFKQKKLKASYEIWNDPKKEELLSDGTKILHDLQMAGGTLLWKEKPAFEEATVLAMAKRNLDAPEQMELVYASINRENTHLCTGNCDACGFCQDKQLVIAQELPQTQPNTLKLICGNCGHNFEKPFIVGATSEIKCPNCFAILDTSGRMIFPPQIIDFNLSCSKCQARNNWLILSKDGDEEKIKCLSCATEHKITFKSSDIKMKYIKLLTALKSVNVRCLSDKVKVLLLDGRKLTIPEIMVDLKEGKELWVYSSKENGEFVPQKIVDAMKTKKDKMLRITLDNNKVFECTYDHLIMMRNGSYKRADELNVGDSLMPFYTMVSEKSGKFNVGGYRFFWDLIKNKWRPVHLWVIKELKLHKLQGGVTHHKDFNKLNNSPTNLPELTHKEHKDIHVNYLKELRKNLDFIKYANERRKSPEAIAKWKKSNQKRFQSEEFKRWAKKNAEKNWKDVKISEQMLKGIRKAKELVTLEGRIKGALKRKVTLKDYFQSREVKKRMSLISKKNWKNPKIRNRILEHLIHPKPETIRKRELTMQKYYLSGEQNEWAKKGGKTVSNRIIEKDCPYCGKKIVGKLIIYAQHLRWCSKREALVNHKIIKVEKIGIKQGYDITIERIPNFAIDSGVFVHNCLQCGTYNEKNIPSTQEVVEIKCGRCGMNFSFDTKSKRVREIEKVEIIDNLSKKSEENSSLNLVKANLIKDIEELLENEIS